MIEQRGRTNSANYPHQLGPVGAVDVSGTGVTTPSSCDVWPLANCYAGGSCFGAPPLDGGQLAGESGPESARPPKSANSPRVITRTGQLSRKRYDVSLYISVGEVR
jgi:hypothetical protein